MVFPLGLFQRVLSRSVSFIAHPPCWYHGQRPHPPQARFPRPFGKTACAWEPRGLLESPVSRHVGGADRRQALCRQALARRVLVQPRRMWYNACQRPCPDPCAGAQRVLLGERWARATATVPSQGPDTHRPPRRTGDRWATVERDRSMPGVSGGARDWSSCTRRGAMTIPEPAPRHPQSALPAASIIAG